MNDIGVFYNTMCFTPKLTPLLELATCAKNFGQNCYDMSLVNKFTCCALLIYVPLFVWVHVHF